jgi:hypothetical protein
MNPQDVATLWACVDEHTNTEQIQPLSPPRAASPLCVYQVTWGTHKVKTFVVNSNFPMKSMKELVQQEKRSLKGKSQPHIFQSQAECGQTKVGKG